MGKEKALTEDRLPPHSPEAEQGCLGCVLITPEHATDSMMQLLQKFPGPEVFYDLRHRKIYDHLCVMHDERTPIDMITLQQRLKDAGQIEAVGGLRYIVSLPDAVPAAANLDFYADIVFEKFKLRTLIQSCTEIVHRCYQDEDKAAGALEEFQRDIIRISQMSNRKGDWCVKQALRDAIKDIEADVKNRGALLGLPTGFIDIDRKTRGLQGGDFIVIAARPGMGKSTLVMNFAEHMAVDNNLSVGVFSLEMSKKSLMRRMISARSRINLFALDDDLLVQEEFSKINKAAGALAMAPIYIDDSRGLDDVQIRSRVRQMYHEHGIKLVIIDYLQLLRTRKRFDKRAQEVGHISNSMKIIAGELNIPVLVCAQLNREVESRKDEKPRISDLKESGDIEQDADLIGLLYEESSNEEAKGPNAALCIGKQRNGPTGTIKLMFRKSIFRFESAAKIRDQDVPKS